MSSNSMTDYVEAFRANLPAGITFDATLNRYFCNDRRYLNEWEVEAYLNYVKKFGFTAISAYSILGLEPPLVLDFDESYFRTGGTATDLVSAATHTRAGNATMVDSDGVLKWAPHNLLTYSEQFDNAPWTQAALTLTTSQIDPFGGNGATRAQGASYLLQPSTVSDGQTKAIWIRSVSGSGTVGALRHNSEGLLNVTEEWQLFELPSDTTEVGGVNFYALDMRAGTITDVVIYGAHLYRSDLGGMVNNPATGNSYVPTTDSARYLPRVGHHIWNGSAWVDEGYFHESEARTNLVTYSEQFDNASWLVANGSVIADQTVSPDGNLSGDNYSVSGDFGILRQVVTVIPLATYTFSFWAKNVDATAAFYRAYNQTDASDIVGTTSYFSQISTDVWKRINFSFTAPSGCTSVGVYVASGNQGGTISFYGAQLEAGSTPSSYIPTAGATVTRAADAMTIPAANLPWSPLAVSIQMEGTMTYADTGSAETVIFYRSVADGSNLITAFLRTDSVRTGDLDFRQVYNGALDNVIGAGAYSPNINVPFNIAVRHGSTFVNGSADGVAYTENTTPTALPYLENTDMQVALTFNGTIKLLRVWADDLTDEGIAEGSSNV